MYIDIFSTMFLAGQAQHNSRDLYALGYEIRVTLF